MKWKHSKWMKVRQQTWFQAVLDEFLPNESPRSLFNATDNKSRRCMIPCMDKRIAPPHPTPVTCFLLLHCVTVFNIPCDLQDKYYFLRRKSCTRVTLFNFKLFFNYLLSVAPTLVLFEGAPSRPAPNWEAKEEVNENTQTTLLHYPSYVTRVSLVQRYKSPFDTWQNIPRVDNTH